MSPRQNKSRQGRKSALGLVPRFFRLFGVLDLSALDTHVETMGYDRSSLRDFLFHSPPVPEMR
jgi:hypothetical protein